MVRITKNTLFTTILASLLVSAANASLASSVDKNYFTFDSVEVQELPLDQAEMEAAIADGSDLVRRDQELWFEEAAAKGGDAAIIGDLLGVPAAEVDLFLRVGKAVWKIIKENEPVKQTAYNSVSVLPKEVSQWNQMANWQTPKSRAYQIIYKNMYGMEVVKFSYRLTYTYGGTYNGKGQYLSNVSVSPIHARVLWGFELNADVQVKNIQNTSSLESPVPGVEIQVNYSTRSRPISLSVDEGAETFYVRGDGYSQKLN